MSLAGSASGARIEGIALVVPNGASLPSLCFKCARRESLHWRVTKFRYVPPWANLLGPIIQLIIMKQAEFALPLCPRCFAHWRTWNRIVTATLALGAMTTIAGIATGGDTGSLVAAFSAVVFPLAVVVILLVRMRYVVHAARVDEAHTWLTRVHPEAMRAALSG